MSSGGPTLFGADAEEVLEAAIGMTIGVCLGLQRVGALATIANDGRLAERAAKIIKRHMFIVMAFPRQRTLQESYADLINKLSLLTRES